MLRRKALSRAVPRVEDEARDPVSTGLRAPVGDDRPEVRIGLEELGEVGLGGSGYVSAHGRLNSAVDGKMDAAAHAARPERLQPPIPET